MMQPMRWLNSLSNCQYYHLAVSHSTHKETAELVAQVNEDALGSGRHIKLMGNLNSYSRRARRFLALRQMLRPSDYSGALFLSL